jgi:hypothetical protein
MKQEFNKLLIKGCLIFLLALLSLANCQSLSATTIRPLIPRHKEGEAMGRIEVGGKAYEIKHAYAQKSNSKKLSIKLILSQPAIENPFNAERVKSVEIHSTLDGSSYRVPLEIYVPGFKRPLTLTGSLYWEVFNDKTVHGSFFIDDGLCWDRNQQRVSCKGYSTFSLSFKARVTIPKQS